MTNPMPDWLYRLIAFSFQILIWGGDLRGKENLPSRGPAVLVANHLGSLGPIAAAACVPRRLYPWIVSAMLDKTAAADYLRVDFVEKELRLKLPLSRWTANVLATVSVPFLRSVGAVAVYRDPIGLGTTFARSIELLINKQFLIVFPEDAARSVDPQLQMSPFSKGFVRLGELYFRRTHEILQFYPLIIHAKRRLVRIEGPIAFNPFSSAVQERLRLKHLLEGIIHARFVAIGSGNLIKVNVPY